jgi:small nuclear ribonucleoprotein (snRNP)-like protein
MSTPTALPQTENALTNEEGTAVIQNWLNQRLRITITDSRSFEGWFKCVDRDANIVLNGAKECRDGPLFLRLYLQQTSTDS